MPFLEDVVLTQGFKQAAEKANFLKGTGFSPYVTTVESTRLYPLRLRFRCENDFLRSLQSP